MHLKEAVLLYDILMFGLFFFLGAMLSVLFSQDLSSLCILPKVWEEISFYRS